MQRLYRSIRFRTWLAFVGFAISMMVFIFSALTGLTPAFYRYMKTQESIDSIALIKNAWYQNDGKGLADMIDCLATERQMDILINIPSDNFTYQKNASGSSQTMISRISPDVKSQLQGSDTGLLFLQSKDNGTDSLLLASYIGDRNNVSAYIFIYSYLEPMGTTMSIMTSMFFLTSTLVLLIGVIIAIILSSHVANPIVRISRNANKLITGNFYMPIKPTEYEEIAVLTQNLNDASKEIAKTENLRKDLIANVSHDLRTPLTMIKAYAEMIRDLSGNNPEKREKHLGVIIDETERLSLLVSDMLNLSKLQSGVVALDKETVNFSEHLSELVKRFSLLNDAKDYSVELDEEDGIYIDCDMHRIEQVAYNLINNAINYIGTDNLVLVRLYKVNADFGRFEVSDHGIGIPEEQIPYIWERYYKVDKSVNHARAVMGTGLGLSIVKNVLETHGFNYGCNSVVGEGSTFWFEFPLGNAENAGDFDE